ncbi:glycosyltransferase family 2 protein [Candidatus Curtissbacteria bacterium]|nr:glycosyltransferase family 2 protein [Candidatus Curtissbacteria bacterium]
MNISFIIVNYKTKELVFQAIESIQKFAKNFTYEIIVVDNNSEDGSSQYLKKNFSKIKLIASPENVGFGKGNNLGIKEAEGDYIFFFNSDAYLIDESIERLFKRANNIPDLGAIAPLILNEDKTIQQSGGYFPTLLKVFFWMSFIDDLPGGTWLKPYHIDHDSFYGKERELDWVTGAAFMVPKKVLEKVGTFDKEIFMYGEDVDLCHRIKKAGLKIIMNPESKIVHIGQGSSGKISANAILGEYQTILHVYKKNGLIVIS